jgi:phosphopantothenoylcysteine decarboxylase / phosphopantothenate---cysteine ligase
VARILITSGPTRQYLDPVRYLTNASSGRMGKALAEAALALGHEVTIITGPVEVEYPTAAKIVPVVSTEEMLAAAAREFDRCDGLIGAAAPCDYRPVRVEFSLIETDDVVATLAARKGRRWVVGFALETEDHRLRALAKLERKHCDLVVSNTAAAIAAPDNNVEVLAPDGMVLATLDGPKESVAREILAIIDARLIAHAAAAT